MQNHDEQILESVAVRRQRLSLALLYGNDRRRRTFMTGIKHVVIGLIIAALICAGCVGFSFISSLFKKERERMNRAMTPANEPIAIQRTVDEVAPW
ncbi:hypothetical protein CJ193_001480 [Pseudoglutamicibacter albus]|uniref:hypothetical protein n=1 Tax=Pseudoglutamicibacter albus TaxID=98671 RepID=UPI0015DD779C|nr:hypothetical protein [Pseudoglutamicibacter albus]WIK84567.1 hypothetical protein CJ193_001480 [Pseudoglutamicibacter albus]